MQDCAEGRLASLTVFLPGVGEQVDASGEIVQNADHDTFLDQLESRITGPPTADCCLKVLYEARYDPCRWAGWNAELLAEELDEVLDDLEDEGYDRIYLHLLGFSIGGIMAVKVAQEIESRDPDQFQVDIVTMATPFATGAFDYVLNLPGVRHIKGALGSLWIGLAYLICTARGLCRTYHKFCA